MQNCQKTAGNAKKRELKQRDVGSEDLSGWGFARFGVTRPNSDRPDDAAIFQGSDREIIRQRWT